MTKAMIGLAIMLQFFGAAAGAQSVCVGDCDGGGAVSIDELIVGVNMALGIATSTPCDAVDANDDGEVIVNELVLAVTRALEGCAGEPATREAVVANYADILFANYSD